MSFYVTLLAVNIGCFLPFYALNFRNAPNPIEFLLLTKKTTDKNRFKILISRPGYSDPFRIDLDFTVVMLLAAGAGHSAAWLHWGAAFLLAVGFIEITYTATIQAIFKRPPAIVSDLSLIGTGLSLAQGHRYWILAAVLALLCVIGVASYAATALLFRQLPQPGTWPVLGALLLLPPGVYRWRSYGYAEYMGRGVYSPLLHFYRNLEYSWRVRAIARKSSEHFASRNHFKGVVLANRPNIVMICVESYGSAVYRDEQFSSDIVDVLAEHEKKLAELGYCFASTFSEPPIFAGGSWLSYASFTYGLRVAEGQLFDALFGRDSNFAAYESLFHILKRSGYSNVLLCPLGGIDARNVDWESIDRCFQSDRNMDFGKVNYHGPLVNYFGPIRRYSPPDQYSLSFAYQAARDSGMTPLSLFFCTLNSHYPWESPEKSVTDWRTLDDPRSSLVFGPKSASIAERYRNAIRYQLDFILRFIVDNENDDLLVVLFGDHQPPFLTSESMGKQTPVHVIGRNTTLMNVLWQQGFAATMNLAGLEPPAIKHEGFLSLFLKGLNAACGKSPDLDIAYRPDGTALFDEV